MEKLKNVLAFIFKLVYSLDVALEDGKINILTEGIPLTTQLVVLPSIVKDLKEILPDIKEAYSDEIKRVEISGYFKREFDIRDDKLEEVIEAVFAATVSIARAVANVVNVIKKE